MRTELVGPSTARDAPAYISEGAAVLGIELGSTRIKAVLIGPDHAPLAVGTHDWENQYVDRTWTYSLDDVWAGLRDCYASLTSDVRARHGVELHGLAGLGVSAMMHGYLPFDAQDRQLAPFRTWRNTNTAEASERLTAAFGHNIPHRWSIAHLYQAILDQEPHVPGLAYLTTLAGYVHWQLTGERVTGIGDASGMFPIDVTTRTYDATMLETFDHLAADAGVDLSLVGLLPEVRVAGQLAGHLSVEGARRLDGTGSLQPGAPMGPAEGDAGTGMVATNSVTPRTGNVSAGTSIFAMVVLERELRRAHRELDIVTTPAGDLVAMVHCNNGASELDAWVGLFAEFASLIGSTVDRASVFEVLLRRSLDGAADCAGLLAYNYLSGEPIVDVEDGRPLVLRLPDSTFDLATFFRTQLYAAFATLRIGIDVLQREEGVRLDRMFAHGGLFKTEGVAQQFLAAALRTPVAVGDVAGEGGAWGMAVLAAFAARSAAGGVQDQSLQSYLQTEVFADQAATTVQPAEQDAVGFEVFLARFVAGLPIARAASDLG